MVGSVECRASWKSFESKGRLALFCFAQKRGRNIPSLPIVRNHGDGFAIVFGNDARDHGVAFGLKRNSFANAKFQHIRMRTYFMQKPQARDDAIVEVDKFGFRQLVDVDGHVGNGLGEIKLWHIWQRALREKYFRAKMERHAEICKPIFLSKHKTSGREIQNRGEYGGEKRTTDCAEI